MTKELATLAKCYTINVVILLPTLFATIATARHLLKIG